MVKIGCCGFPVSRQTYYKELQLIEIQQTFYQLPRIETTARWRENALRDVEFTLKAWQGITHLSSSPTYRKYKLHVPEDKKARYGHFQPTDEVFQAWEDTVKIANSLSATIVILQCPPNFKESDQNLQNLKTFFQYISEHEFAIALELRVDWNWETIKAICQQYDLIHCVDPFREDSLHDKIRYYRLHGSPPGKKMYRYQYQSQDFKILNEKILCDFTEIRNVYCLFNNSFMWEDACAFKKYLNTKSRESHYLG